MDIAPFEKLLKRHCGLRFDGNGAALLLKALLQRAAACADRDMADYYRRLQRDAHELQELVSLVTVNETYFFREAEQLRFCVERLIPRLLANRLDAGPVRILSAGCASGEEPYSIAIALQEKYGASAAQRFQLSAGDIDKTALGKAQTARYGEYAFRGLDPALRERYFEPHGHKTWRIQSALRERVAFYPLNLLDPVLPPDRNCFDLIFFRNVSIYFDAPTRRSILHRLALLLDRNGYLLVGSSETLGNDCGILALQEDSGYFYFAHPVPGTAMRTPLNRPTAMEGKGVDALLSSARPLRDNSAPSAPRASVPRGDPENRHDAGSTPPQVADPADSACPADFEQLQELVREHRYDAALSAIAAALRQRPHDAQALLLQAYILLDRKEFDAADIAAQRVLDGDNWSVDACILRALAAKWRGQTDTALEYLKRATYVRHDCWPAHYYSAEIHRAAGRTEKARRSYQTVLRLLAAEREANTGLSVVPLDLPPAQIRFLCEHHLTRLDGAAAAMAK